MGAETYKEGCTGCQISQGGKCVSARGGIINLNGNWIVNQYGGREGFLGWLILQPRYHREWFADLEPAELEMLGENIKNVEKALRCCWAKQFDDDPIGRIYTLCFSESGHHHIHFHIIPRTKKIETCLMDREKGLIAWNMYKARQQDQFPKEYVTTNGKSDRVLAFVSCLRAELETHL